MQPIKYEWELNKKSKDQELISVIEWWLKQGRKRSEDQNIVKMTIIECLWNLNWSEEEQLAIPAKFIDFCLVAIKWCYYFLRCLMLYKTLACVDILKIKDTILLIWMERKAN